jgi:1-deoxy-D-xylulose-5-phosphate reductoisomerase
MKEIKTISILGSTGSIGKQALEVIEKLEGRVNLFALAAGNNTELLKKQIMKFKPEVVSVKYEKDAYELSKRFKNIYFLFGNEGLCAIAGHSNNDMVLVGVTGLYGLKPVLSAIENGIDVALANKETLVSAGEIIKKKLKEKRARIIPVDSEHSAIFQCINGKNAAQAKKIILTASGGPFRLSSLEKMAKAGIKETLSHPNWSMGNKITVDSATLMNKGLEVIEAHYLFDFDYKNIEVLIHPQSIVHGAVEFYDGSVIAQMGLPTMHIPIQYALTYPERYEGIKTSSLNLAQAGKLEFFEPDLEKFPCLRLGYEAGIKGGTYPAALNALNETAVNAFLEEKIKLTDIASVIEKGLETHKSIKKPSLEDIWEIDKQTREWAEVWIKKS